MIKSISAVFLFVLFTAFGVIEDKTTPVLKVLSVDYYNKNSCSEKAPVFVRITFQYTGNSRNNVRMVQRFADDIVKTVDLNQTDANGNFVYEFCAAKDRVLEFTAHFADASGQKTNDVMVRIDVVNAHIKDENPGNTFPID